MRADMVVAYVRDLLGRLTGEVPQFDQDGDLPVHFEGATFYVRVVGSNPVVQVFSVAVAGVSPSPELHTALNEINTHLHFARAFHVQGQVLMEHEIWGEDVNPANYAHACRNVAQATDVFGEELAQRFGGSARFEESKTDAYRAQPDNVAGPYL